MPHEIALAVIVSLDTFLAAAACCSGGIKIPPLPAAVISAICAGVLGVSLELSEAVGVLLPEGVCRVLGFAVLTALGAATIIKSLVRSAVRRIAGREEVMLKLGGCSIAVRLYLDDRAADFDCSKALSVPEAAALALASSLDSAATGLSCGFGEIRPVWAALWTLGAGIAALGLGALTGRKVASLGHELSWVGGVLLIVYAVFEVL